MKVNATPLNSATLTEWAAIFTSGRVIGAVLTTLLTSTQWKTAVLAQTYNQVLKVNATPMNSPTVAETAAMITGTTHIGAIVLTHLNSTQ